jgi:hypothetical protein
MASDKSTFVWSPDTLTPGLAAFPVKLATRLGIFFEMQSNKVQDYMRNNAPWTDRTGNARQGLFAKSAKDGAGWVITAYHTVPYGIWLEVAHSGHYAIINPTIQAEGRRIMKDLNGFLGRFL